MSNHKNIIELIKAISGQSNVLTIPRLFIDLTKSHRAALLLSQCVYWSDKTRDPDGWFYKTYKDWKDELGIPRRGIDTATSLLYPMIETKIRRVGPTPKKHYRVNLDLLETRISEMLETRISDLSRMNTSDLLGKSKSTYTKTTFTKTTAKNGGRPPAEPKGWVGLREWCIENGVDPNG